VVDIHTCLHLDNLNLELRDRVAPESNVTVGVSVKVPRKPDRGLSNMRFVGSGRIPSTRHVGGGSERGPGLDLQEEDLSFDSHISDVRRCLDWWSGEETSAR